MYVPFYTSCDTTHLFVQQRQQTAHTVAMLGSTQLPQR